MSFSLEMLQIITSVNSDSKFYLEHSNNPSNLLFQNLNIVMRDTKIIVKVMEDSGKNRG